MKTKLPALFLVLACHFNSMAQYDELKPGRSPSQSNATQNGNFVNFKTVACQIYVTINTPTFSVGFYLSTDTTITTSDILAASYTVDCMNSAMPACSSTNAASGIERACSVSNVDMTLLPGLLAGNYFAGTIIDYQNVVTEPDETNNAWGFGNATNDKTVITYSPLNNVGIRANSLEGNIESMYMNDGSYSIKSRTNLELNVELYSIDGKLLAKDSGTSIILPKQSSGLYLARISNATGTVSKKIIQ